MERQSSFPTTVPATFARRRRTLAGHFGRFCLEHPSTEVRGALFPAGWARPRNFAHSHFPFRAESHFLYLVGRHLEGAVLALQRSGEACLFVTVPDPAQFVWTGPQRGPEELAEECGIPCRPLEELADAVDGGDWAVVPPQDEATAAWLESILGRSVEAQSAPFVTGRDACLARAIVATRLVHDEEAIAQMRAAAALTAQTHRRAMRATRAATTEAEVRAAVEGCFIAAGLGNAYSPIVTTRGEILHAERSDGMLAPGQLLLCDAGVESAEGWASDVTRTWPTSGRYSPSQAAIVELVVDVQRRAIEAARPGTSFVDLHLSAQAHFTEGLHDLGILQGGIERCQELELGAVFFPHGLGHLLGLDVHDMEDLGDRAGYGEEANRASASALRLLRLARRLRPNMVVTIEPGFYQVPGLLAEARGTPAVSECIDWQRLAQFADVRGVRIEDDVRITLAEPEVLSEAAPKSVADVEAWMAS